jgi:hypothetical protein
LRAHLLADFFEQPGLAALALILRLDGQQIQFLEASF